MLQSIMFKCIITQNGPLKPQTLPVVRQVFIRALSVDAAVDRLGWLSLAQTPSGLQSIRRAICKNHQSASVFSDSNRWKLWQACHGLPDRAVP
jgi:hypothetical protein